MEQAYFTQIRSKILPYLDNAQDRVEIAMAWFTSAELFSALLRCLDRKVKVGLVLLDNPTNFMYYAPDFNEFINAGGELRIAGAEVGFMHHKFCIIDDEVVITGSYNWTYYAETRNVENIVITDDASVVNLYKQEFYRLTQSLTTTESAPRYTEEVIQTLEDIDFREINYEIEHICHARNLPVQKIFETKTVVQIVETKLTTVSSRNIGILLENDYFEPIINANRELPYETKMKFFYDSKNEKTFYCKFVTVSANDASDIYLINESDLLQIARGTSDENLPIEISMKLDVDGSLRIEAHCLVTNRKLMISAIDPKLIRHE